MNIFRYSYTLYILAIICVCPSGIWLYILYYWIISNILVFEPPSHWEVSINPINCWRQIDANTYPRSLESVHADDIYFLIWWHLLYHPRVATSEETSIEVPPLRNIDCKLRSLTEDEACGSSTLRGATDMLPGKYFYNETWPLFYIWHHDFDRFRGWASGTYCGMMSTNCI